MPSAESAAQGRALLRERVAEAPGILRRLPDVSRSLLELERPLPRTLVTTGIGTSEGHARHLAETAVRGFGWPARFASTGSLEAGPPPGSERDWLVVFSQGLSPNARVAFSRIEAWGAVLLVTGLGPELTPAEGLTSEKRAWLAALEEAGVVRIDLGCGAEYGALLRVVGARAGYLAAWRLLRSLARRRLDPEDGLAIDPARLVEAQREAPAAAARIFPPDESLARFFGTDRELILVSQGGAGEWVGQLSLKIAEGMLRPRPAQLDVLQFAHGPLQTLAEREASILYLASADESDEAARWRTRFQATLDPDRHDLRIVHTTLRWPFAAVELEAIFDEWVLRVLDETERDLVDWPGASREAALYEAGPARMPDRAAPAVVAALDYEDRVWPELEEMIRAGARTAILALGSIEQHGPHLPLGTDRWIADALARGLAARRPEALAIPAVAVGCAEEHLDFAGTLHVSPETLESLIGDLLDSLSHHGIERVFAFTAHGGNVDALRAMAPRLVARAAPMDLRIETDLRVGAMQSEAVAHASLDPLAAGPHAGEYETSLVAWLRPGRVREPRPSGRLVATGEAQALFYPSLRPHAASGVLGDPSRASAARGARYLEAWLDLLEGAYADAFDSGPGSPAASTGAPGGSKNRQ